MKYYKVCILIYFNCIYLCLSYIENFNKLVSISRYLQSLYEKVRAKSSERLKNTRETNENLRKKLSKNGQTKSFKFDYAKNIEDFFDFFSYKMSSNYPGKVILIFKLNFTKKINNITQYLVAIYFLSHRRKTKRSFSILQYYGY